MSTVTMSAEHANRCIDRVIHGGYCIGCGACAVQPESPMRIALDTNGKLQAARTQSAGTATVHPCLVCPFSGEGDNEDAIGRKLFSQTCTYEPGIGYAQGFYAGSVNDEQLRVQSSSGGLITWLLLTLLRQQKIDGVAHVRPRTPTKDNPLVLQYEISRTEEEIQSGCGSHYYPVEMSGVLKAIRKHEGRYAVVGVPKFITAVRLLMRHDSVLQERIAYCIGIIAGHMKSKLYADSIAWQQGIAPGNLTGITFRKKRPYEIARNCDVVVTGKKDAKNITIQTHAKHIYNRNDWGLKCFEYEAADFSDDLMAETADIACGDAWLPRFVKQWRGTSVVIVRNTQLHDLLREGIDSGALQMEQLDAKHVRASQSGGLRHMQDGIHVRAAEKQKEGKWHPPIRFESPALSAAFARVIQARSTVATESYRAFHAAVKAGSYTVFWRAIRPIISAYYRSRTPKMRIAGWLRRYLPFV